MPKTRLATRPKSPAVSSTPTVASVIAGAGRLPEGVKRRAEAGIEQDHGERQRADEIGERGVVELDPQAVDAGKQPDAQEEEQQRRAEAEGEQARKGGQRGPERCRQG